MKRFKIFGLAAIFLAATSTAAVSGEWTSKISSLQRHGPKFGDYLKGKTAGKAGTPPKRVKKEKPGATSQ